MMGRAGRKLNSSRGASLVLALALVLLCVLTAGSVIASASSNAGRARSGEREQQAYLVLSSAMTMVMDDLSGGTYRGRWERVQDPDTGETALRQVRGDYDCRLGALVLDELDKLYAAGLRGASGVSALYGDSSAPESVSFTIAPSLEELAGFQVSVTVDFDCPLRGAVSSANYHMSVTARLSGAPEGYPGSMTDGSYGLQAELSPDGAVPALPGQAGEPSMTWTPGVIARLDTQSGEAS